MVLRTLRRHRLTRLTAWLLVATAALAAAPRSAAARSAGDPCAAHAQHAIGPAGHAHHAPTHGRALRAAMPDGCTHCPVTACVFVSPCGGTSTALAAARLAGTDGCEHLGLPIAAWRPAHSRTQAPPTPPPHGLL